MIRKNPGQGFAERSVKSRKVSVPLANADFDAVLAIARTDGVSTAEIVRRAVTAYLSALAGGKGGEG